MTLQNLKVERKKDLTKDYVPPKPMKRIYAGDGPQWEHDCKRCVFLTRKDKYDYYVCTEIGGEPTFIVRVGNSPEEYHSLGMSSIISIMLDGYIDHPLVDCMKYALRNNRVRVSYKTIEVFQSYWRD